MAGGYLVLESPNVGVVLATNKRFYCTVEAVDPAVPLDPDHKNDAIMTEIVVKSPQFHSEWSYTFTATKDVDDTTPSQYYYNTTTLTPSTSNETVNGFVEKTLRLTLSYILDSLTTTTTVQQQQQQQVLPTNLQITIRADNDFYSVIPHLQERNLPATPESVDSLPSFLPCPRDTTTNKTIVHKTGLGSSAALVTSCVGALLHFFGLAQQDAVYNLSQICHCHAQGKVGSGFDVSAAVHGSHVYRRFPKHTLTDLLERLEETTAIVVVEEENSSSSSTKTTRMLLKDLVESKWEGGVVCPLGLPEGLELLLADVCGGSESPSMARKVLAWKASRENPTEESYWEQLRDLNQQIVDMLTKDDNTNVDVDLYSPTTCQEWKGSSHDDTNDNETTTSIVVRLEKALKESRTLLKAMGVSAGVPVEPDEQTALANATQELPGVVAALVPGAGGYDALACLYVNDKQGTVKKRIGELWAGWTQGGATVCPLAVKAGSYGEGMVVEQDFAL